MLNSNNKYALFIFCGTGNKYLVQKDINSVVAEFSRNDKAFHNKEWEKFLITHKEVISDGYDLVYLP